MAKLICVDSSPACSFATAVECCLLCETPEGKTRPCRRHNITLCHDAARSSDGPALAAVIHLITLCCAPDMTHPCLQRMYTRWIDQASAVRKYAFEFHFIF